MYDPIFNCSYLLPILLYLSISLPSLQVTLTGQHASAKLVSLAQLRNPTPTSEPRLAVSVDEPPPQRGGPQRGRRGQ